MSDRRLSSWLTVSGTLLLVLYIVIAWLSQSFSYGHGHQDRPILSFVGVYGVAFLVYAVAVWRVKRQAAESGPLTLVLIFAALFRLVLLFSEPIQEDDFYRYLWDGKVVASGLNPYRFTPREVQTDNGKEGPLQPYRKLAETDAHFALLLSRINHPDVPTLYPPVAQARVRSGCPDCTGQLARPTSHALLLRLGSVSRHDQTITSPGELPAVGVGLRLVTARH